MKVAIVGAGAAGLSCAYEFKKHGITPTVFEKHRRIAEDVDFVTTTLKLFDISYSDPIKNLRNKYGIEIKPSNTLKEIVMNSQNEQTIIKGAKGYFFIRGEYQDSLESQLARIADVPIIFDKKIYIEDIRDKYDYVIDATGTFDYAKKLGIMTPYLEGFSRVAVIDGKFNVNTATMWLNTEYSKNCFVFQIPHSENKACVAITVNNITQPELDYYWKNFIIGENIKNTIIKTKDILHEAGNLSNHKVGNVYFVGKAGGFLGQVLGLGMYNAIETGVLAARSIIKNKDYEKLVQYNVEFFKKTNEFRKALNKFDNKDFDNLVSFLGLPVIKQAIYNNPFAKITQGTILAKVYNKFKK